jgi:hypothetical protein
MLVLLDCGPQELSRSKAKELISQKIGTQPVEYGVQFGPVVVPRVRDANDLEASPQGKYYRLLETAKMVQLTVEKFTHDPNMGSRAWLTVAPTDQAAKYILKKMSPVSIVAICYPEVREVTGITGNGEKTNAHVEYTLAYGNMTPFAAPLKQAMPEEYNALCADTRKASANFARFDDGWRLQ